MPSNSASDLAPRCLQRLLQLRFLRYSLPKDMYSSNIQNHISACNIWLHKANIIIYKGDGIASIHSQVEFACVFHTVPLSTYKDKRKSHRRHNNASDTTCY